MRIILHAMYAARELSSEGKIVVHSPDADVFILLVANATRISQQVFFETGKGTNRRRIDVTGIQKEIGN